MRIAVVDDNATNRKVLRVILESAGHVVHEALDGLDALGVLEREGIDAVISDILMPRMDGYRLCYEVRRSARFQNVPFIVYTSTYTSPSDEKFALELGADHFLRKPVPAETLLTLLRELRPRPPRSHLVLPEELMVMKEYNERLVAKLEEKNADLLQHAEELTVIEEELRAQNLELAAARDALEAERQRYADLFQFAPDGYLVTDKASRILEANRVAKAMLGVNKASTPAEPLATFVAEEDLPEFYERLSRLASGGEPVIKDWLLTVHAPRRSAFPAALTVTAAPGRPGRPAHLRWLLRDISRQKQSEQKLRQSDQRFSAFVENLPGYAWIKDTKGRYVYLNRACARLTRRRGNCVGKTDQDLWPPEMAARYKANDRKVIASGKVLQTVEPYPRNGTQGFVMVSKFPIFDEAGCVSLVGGVGVDITERQQAQEQLRALAARLREVREQEDLRMAREIHDVLGQPLTSLNMDVIWLGRRIKEQKDRRLRSELRPRLKAMESLLGETVKSVQRISSDLRPGMLDDLGLAATLEWQAEDFERRTRIRCKWKRKPQAVELENVQATALFRIFQEILTNIARHAQARSLSLDLRRKNGALRLEVADDGKGFAEERLSDRKSLGLLGMRERAALIGASLQIHSVRGKGTTVRVALPMATAPSTQTTKHPSKSERHENPDRR